MSYAYKYLFPAKMFPYYAKFLREADRWSLPISIKALHLKKFLPLNCILIEGLVSHNHKIMCPVANRFLPIFTTITMLLICQSGNHPPYISPHKTLRDYTPFTLSQQQHLNTIRAYTFSAPVQAIILIVTGACFPSPETSLSIRR